MFVCNNQVTDFLGSAQLALAIWWRHIQHTTLRSLTAFSSKKPGGMTDIGMTQDTPLLHDTGEIL